MRYVRTAFAAAALGVSVLTVAPARAADDDSFKKTQIDKIPVEAREKIQDHTKGMTDVEVFIRRMDGEDFYTTFYVNDEGRRMEMRVDKDGKVVSKAHETREQPGDMKDDKDAKKDDKDAKRDDKNKDDKSKNHDADSKVAKDYAREPEKLADMPKAVQETMNKETASATDQGYFRLRRDGDDIFSVFYTPKDGQRQELRVDKSGKVVSRHVDQPDDALAAADAQKKDQSANDDAAQPAASRQPAAGAPLPPQQQQKPAPKPAPAPAKEEQPAAAKDANAKPVLKEIKKDDLPEAVRKAIEFKTRDAMNVEYRSWTRGGKQYYTTFYTPKGSIKQMEYRTDAEGKALEEAHEANPKD